MAVSFSAKNTHARSASFPPKTNLMVEKVEMELKKLGKSEELCTSEMETIEIGLSGLARLYKCVDESLKLRLTKQSLLPCHANSLVEVSSKLLPICTTSKQMLATLRAACSTVRSTLESDSHDDNDGSSLSSYLRARKETIVTSKEVTLSLRQLEAEAADNLGCSQESDVSRVLISIAIINVSVLGSLFRFLMTKPAKQGLLHKLGLTKKISGKAATLPSKNGNKLSDVDAALLAFFAFPKHGDADILGVALKRLESMESALLELEDDLSLLLTVLNKIRTSLQKIISV